MDTYSADLPVGQRRLLYLLDMLLVAVSLWFAFALRHSAWWSFELQQALWLVFATTLLTPFLFTYAGVYRFILYYFGKKELRILVYAATLQAVIALLLSFIDGFRIPLSVFAIYWGVCLLGLFGTRLVLNMALHKTAHEATYHEPVIVYGAGGAGAQLVKSLQDESTLRPIAFVDDDAALLGKHIHGVKVHSAAELPHLLARHQVSQVLLAMPSLSREKRRELLNRLQDHRVHVRTVPPFSDLVCGAVRVDDIRELDIEDILGREPVAPQERLLTACIAERAVMVTGAGGSIGSELCRQILRCGPRRLLLFELSEYGLYEIERELRATAACSRRADVEIVPLLGSVLDEARLRSVLQYFPVDTIFHAAAYKHVPLLEHNLIDGVKNNVIGTWNAARQALNYGVGTFVLISTDKAVRPASIMGAAKRAAELVVQGLSTTNDKTRFSIVRFGNVLDSSGSVVPLFREQILRGGPVTVTHPDVMRYFMTIPEAAQLVIQAGAMAIGGDVFVLDMGEPFRIVDLARRMVFLSGRRLRAEGTPDGDIEIVFTGLRPGEKLSEELLLGNSTTATDHPRIMRAHEPSLPWPRLRETLDHLVIAISRNDCERVHEMLTETVQGYAPQNGIKDLVWMSMNREPAPRTASNAAM